MIFGTSYFRGEMNADHDVSRLKRKAEWVTWQIDGSDLGVMGTDESGLVRVWLDGTGQVEQVEIGGSWWRDLGPERLSTAILDAINEAVGARLAAWSARLTEREEGEPPADWQPPADRLLTETTPARWSCEQVDESDRADQMARVLGLLSDAMSELDDYRQRLEEQAQRQVIGRSGSDRVTVAMVAGQVSRLEVSPRWLREQPGGPSVADEVRDACQDAYQRGAEQRALTLASSPAISQLRHLAAEPTTLLRHLGLHH